MLVSLRKEFLVDVLILCHPIMLLERSKGSRPGEREPKGVRAAAVVNGGRGLLC